MTPRSKRFLSNLALLCGALVVSLLLGELLVRMLAPQDLQSSLSWYEAHPVYRFRHRPNMDREARWFTTYHLQTNSRGLRGSKDYAYDADGKWRVLVHGDSFTFGNGLNGDDLFVSRTERQLRQAGIEHAQVINMGVSAHGTSLEYLYFLEEGRQYEPDVVVVAIFLGNDYLDDYRDEAFTLEDGELVYHPYDISWMKRMTNNAAYQFLAANSHLLVFLRSRLTAIPGQEREVDAYTDLEMFDELYARNKAVLLNFAEAIEAVGAQSLFLLLPTPGQLLADQGVEHSNDYFPQAGRYRDALLETCEEKRLKCVDLLPAMSSETDDIWSLFLEDPEGQRDFHYNANGHKIVADVLAGELVRLY